ncbi:hypothetical protein [Fulvimarina sp. MAC8]|uniref:hypothetical protein n=1 Tax=Fulvimarina sp. MAC8 TaxID=3162874 RepID=UPI0032F0809D
MLIGNELTMQKKSLTQRERQAAAILGQGRGRAGLMEALAITQSSADKYIRSLKDKLGGNTLAELTLLCSRLTRPEPRSPAAPLGMAIELAAPPSAADGETGGEPHPVTSADLAGLATFPELFDRFAALIPRFSARYLVWSHLRLEDDRTIRHFATRWNFPPNVEYDMSLPIEQNFAARHAFSSWDPLPLDIELVADSEMSVMLPEAVLRQNRTFIEAGMVRGIIFVLPGLECRDRIVSSVLFDGIDRAAFPAHVIRVQPALYQSVMALRNAHVALTPASAPLSPNSAAILRLLQEDVPMDEICETLGIGRRSADRYLSEARETFGVATNIALMARFVDHERGRILPF